MPFLINMAKTSLTNSLVSQDGSWKLGTEMAGWI